MFLITNALVLLLIFATELVGTRTAAKRLRHEAGRGFGLDAETGALM